MTLIAGSLFAMFGGYIGFLLWEGPGIWGNNNPVGWAWDIVNFVFWVGIGHAGTLISAILYLFRHRLSGILRHEQAMVIDYENLPAVSKHLAAWKEAVAGTRSDLQQLLEGEEDEDNPLAREALTQLDRYAGATSAVFRNIESGGYDNAAAVSKMLNRSKEIFAGIEASVTRIDGIVRIGSENQSVAVRLMRGV